MQLIEEQPEIAEDTTYIEAFAALPRPLDYETAKVFTFRWSDSYQRLPTILQFADEIMVDNWEMKDRDWFRVLGYFWTGFDNVGRCIDELMYSPFGEIADRELYDYTRRMSKSAIKARDKQRDARIAAMMNEDEYAAYLALPDEVTTR